MLVTDCAVAPCNNMLMQSRLAKDTFDLWDILKTAATQYALSDKPLPTSEECTEVINRLVAENGFSSLPSIVRAFYATELGDLIGSLRANRQSA